jgi:hypothetical protein
MKFYQTHARHWCSDGHILHCINYMKAANKATALAEAMKYYNGDIKNIEFYALEVSKKTILDQADYYEECSKQFKKDLKENFATQNVKDVLERSWKANANWARILRKLVKG